MAGVLFFAAIISLFENIRAEVIGTNASVCLNTSRAVLTCITVTSTSGGLIWLDSNGTPAITFNSQSTVGSNHTSVNGFYITLTSITTATEGTIYTSTATTAGPVNISYDGMSLGCSSDGVNVITVTIHIIKNVSSPLNFKCLVSNCMSTECTVTCTWDPPNDTPLCVTEYIIRNESDYVGCGNLPTVQEYVITGHVHPIYIICSEQDIGLSHVQGHITNTSFSVNKFTNYLLVVVAKNFNFSQSNSNEYFLNTKRPGYDFDFVLLDPVNVTLDMNTTLLISWEYIPNRPPITNQNISIDDSTYVISIANRSATFNVTRNQTYSITFEASNVIGIHSIAKHIFVPSNGSVVKDFNKCTTGGVDPDVVTRVSTGVFVILVCIIVILVCIIIGLIVYILKLK